MRSVRRTLCRCAARDILPCPACIHSTHTARACVNTRLTHARRVRGVRAECGGMRYGFYFFVPLLTEEPRVGDKEKDEEGDGREFTSSHPRPSSPSIHLLPLASSTLFPPLPPPLLGFSSLEILLFPPFPVPLSGWLSDAPAARSHTRCPRAGRDVTAHPAVTSSPSPSRREACARTAYAATSRVQTSYARGTTRSFSDDDNDDDDDDDDGDALTSADLWPDSPSSVRISEKRASFPAISRGRAAFSCCARVDFISTECQILNYNFVKKKNSDI